MRDVLETARLRLEPWDEARREGFVGLALDPVVMRYVNAGRPFSRDEADGLFERELRRWESEGFGWRSIVVRDSGEWVGFAGLNRIGAGTEGISEDQVEIGWWLAPAAWGRGYATEAAAALRDEGLGRVGLDRIVARCHPENRASRRVAEKIGMSLAGETTTRHGAVTVVIYSLERDP